ncbi:MAG: hypothetical protein ACYS6K_14215 [Planctomycetota bacterium]|jgi:uncharacterized membrane protein
MNNTQNNNKKPKDSIGPFSAIVKIFELTLDFIEKLSQRRVKGDRLGATIQLLTVIIVLLVTLCIILAILDALSESIEWTSLLVTIVIIIGILALTTILALLFRTPDDTRLAKGQALRVSVIQPKSIYKRTS